MGTCLSKKSSTTTTKSPTSTHVSQEVKVKHIPHESKKNPVKEAIVAPAMEPGVLKKEVLVIKHRKSHEIDRNPDSENPKFDSKKNPNAAVEISESTTSSAAAAVSTVRTSSCTKEEVDAILIQCGRLSRSSSTGKTTADGSENPNRRRRYSGSKRSFDFDVEPGSAVVVEGDGGRHRQRDSRVSSPSSSRRRSRERGSGGGGGRRVSRSPNRRSESPIPNPGGGGNGTTGGGGINRPAKMVSVPATDKTNNGGAGEVVAVGGGGMRRIQVKQNAGEAVVYRCSNENQNPQPLSISLSNSRKAESPFKRNPLLEIDNNAKVQMQKVPNSEKMTNNKGAIFVDSKGSQMTNEAKTPMAVPREEPSYASLLLEDIQNFHQNKTAAAAPPPFSLPASISKACSILDAVADLNSTTRRRNPDQKVNRTHIGEPKMGAKDDAVESNLHKYVTVGRGGAAAADTEDQESSGSNSFVGSQQLTWLSSSWEPNSGDSTDGLTPSSRSNTQYNESSSMEGLRSSGGSERREFVGFPRNGIGRGRIGGHGQRVYSMPDTSLCQTDE